MQGQSLYEAALYHIQAGTPEQALPLFERFIRDNPQSPLLPDALYWLGESRTVLGRQAEAVQVYTELARRFPTHARTPTAMLRLGQAHEQLGDPHTARFFYQALVDEHPGSEAASQARQLLQE